MDSWQLEGRSGKLNEYSEHYRHEKPPALLQGVDKIKLPQTLTLIIFTYYINSKTAKIMLLIGIDVGMQPNNTGFATYRTESKKIYRLRSGSLWSVMKWIFLSVLDMDQIHIILEDSSMDRVTFQKGATQGISNKLSRDAGKNQGGAIIIKQMCKDLNIPCLCIPPSKRNKVHKRFPNVQAFNMPTKTTKAQFKQLTGYSENKGNNEHSRDAGTLVWGMTEKRFEILIKMQSL